MNSFFVKMWFGAVLGLLSSLIPTWMTRDYVLPMRTPMVVSAKAKAKVAPALPHQKHVSPKPAAAMPVQPSVLCELNGQTIYQGLPYGNADIDFWVTTPRGQEMRHIKSDADGMYRLTLTMPARTNEPLDWEMKAHTSDFKTLHRSGRRIIRDDEPAVAIRNVIEFIAD